MLAAVATGAERWQFLLWQCGPCIVVPRKLSALGPFAHAVRQSQQRGFPVFVRETGGGAVVQGPGVVNVSVAFAVSPQQPDRIRAAFEYLCAPLIDLLRRKGIEASNGTVPGAMCDGAYNVVVDRRKLAGTAQRWRSLRTGGGAAGYAALAHLVLSVDADQVAACDAVNTLYTALDVEARVCAESHVNWTEIVMPADRGSTARLFAELSEAYRAAGRKSCGSRMMAG